MANKKYLQAVLQKIAGDGWIVASDDTVDRHGEVIEQEGWDLKNYKVNPVILWSHDGYEPMIGRANPIKLMDIDGKKKLIFKPEFHRKTEMSRMVSDLYEAGFLTTVSVGFLVKDMIDNIIKKAELLEISFCNIPANPSARELAMTKGYSAKTIDSYFGKGEETTEEVEEPDKTDKPDKEEKKCKPKPKEVEADKEVEAEIEAKKVVPYKYYPLADKGMAWDGPAQMGSDVSDLKVICAWFDAEKPEVKSSYKLPHHLSEGYKTVWRGVVAAMGALLGARGGVKIPEEDKKSVYNHLAKHYKDFDEEPPEMKDYTPEELKAMFETDNSVEKRIQVIEEKVDSLVVGLTKLTKPEVSKSPQKDDKGRVLGQEDENVKRLIQHANKLLSIALSYSKGKK